MIDLNKVKNTKFYCCDLDQELTIKDYLKCLLVTVWQEGESFSGKRPFGNSGWEYDLYIPLIKGGYIEGELDEDGYIDSCDDKEASRLILAIIHDF